jgi:hypothetical protein
MASEEDTLDRRIRLWSAAIVAILIGLRLAMDVYSGPSIMRGLSIAGAIALALGLLSLLFGRRFWHLMAYLLFFSC